MNSTNLRFQPRGYSFRTSSGSLAMFAAIRRASSRVARRGGR
jgi:hypothetical protein